MKLSTRGRYALRLLQDLAAHGSDERPVSLARVASRTEISLGYLEQLALALRRAGLIRGVAGRNGGYLLNRPPEDITLREAVEATVGPITIVDCVSQPEDCIRSGDCTCRDVYALVNRRVAETFEEFTVADLTSSGGGCGEPVLPTAARHEPGERRRSYT